MKRGRSAGGEPCVWAYRTQGPECGARERSPHRRRPWRFGDKVWNECLPRFRLVLGRRGKR